MKLYYLIILIALGSSSHASKVSSEDVVSFVNDDKHFDCEGSDVKWLYPNGTLINSSSKRFHLENLSENVSRLIVKKIDAMLIGTYRCISLTDDIEKNFHLKLYFPLTISHKKIVYISKENESVVLKCKTISVPVVEKITWYFGDSELVPEVDYKKASDGILLENLKPQQAGEYSCVAIQKFEELKDVQEREMELIVEYAPRQNGNNVNEVYGRIGETVSLNCDATSVPTPRFTWLQSGYETFKNIKIRDSTSTLSVKINSEKSFVTYTCLASNEHGLKNQTFILKEKTQSDISNDSTRATEYFTIMLLLIISTFMCF